MTKRMLATLLSMIMFLIPLTTSAIALATTITTAEFTVKAVSVDSSEVVTTQQDGPVSQVAVIVGNQTLTNTEDGLKIKDGTQETNISNELLIEDLNNKGDNDDLAKGDHNKGAIDGENADEDDIYIDNMPSSGSNTTVVTGSPSDVDKFKNESGESRTGQVTTDQLNGATTDAEMLEKAKEAKLNELNKLKSELEAKALASATDAQKTLWKSTDTTTASKTDIINSILGDADKKQYKDVNYTIDMVSSASSTSILLNSGISIETDKSGTWTTLDGKDALLMTITAQAFGSSNLLTINEKNEVIADVSGIKNIILNIDTSGSMANSMGNGQTRWSVLCAAVQKFVESMVAAGGENVKITLIAYNGGSSDYEEIVRTVGTYSMGNPASRSDLLSYFDGEKSSSNGFGLFEGDTGRFTDNEAGYFETNRVIEQLKAEAGDTFNPNNVSVVYMTDGAANRELQQASGSMFKDADGNLYYKIDSGRGSNKVSNYYSVADGNMLSADKVGSLTPINGGENCSIYKDANGDQYYKNGDDYYSVANGTELSGSLIDKLTPVKRADGDVGSNISAREAAANEAVELLKKGVNLYNIVITNDDTSYDYKNDIRQYFDPEYAGEERTYFDEVSGGAYKKAQVTKGQGDVVYYKENETDNRKVDVFSEDGESLGTVWLQKNENTQQFTLKEIQYNGNNGRNKNQRFGLITKQTIGSYLKSRIEMANKFAETADANYAAISEGKIDFTVAKNENDVTEAYEKIASSIVNQIATKALIAYNAGVIDEIPAGYDVVLSETSKGATVTTVAGTDGNDRQIITWNIGDMFNAEEYKLEYFLVPKAKITDEEGEAFERYGVTSVGSKAALFCDAVDGRKDLVIVLDNPVIDIAPSNKFDELGTVDYDSIKGTVEFEKNILNNDSSKKLVAAGASATDIKVEGLSDTAKVELIANGSTTTLANQAVESNGNGNGWMIELKYGTVFIDESGEVSFQRNNENVAWTYDEYRDTEDEIRSIKVTFEYKVSTDVTVRTNFRTLSSILVPVSFNITPPVAPRYDYSYNVVFRETETNSVKSSFTSMDPRTSTDTTMDYTVSLSNDKFTKEITRLFNEGYDFLDNNGNIIQANSVEELFSKIADVAKELSLTSANNNGTVYFDITPVKYNYYYDVNFVATGTNAGENLRSFTNVGSETNTTETSKTFTADPSASDFEELIKELYDLGYDFVDKDGNRIDTSSKTTIATLAKDLQLTADRTNSTAKGVATFYLKLLDYKYSYDVVFKATGTNVELGSVTGLEGTTTTATTTTFSASPSKAIAIEALEKLVLQMYNAGYDFVDGEGNIITSNNYTKLANLVQELRLNASRANPEVKATATFYLKPFEYEYFYNIVFKALNDDGAVLGSFTNLGTKKDTATTTTFTVNPNTETDTAITEKIAQLLNKQGYDFIQDANGNVIDLNNEEAVAEFVKTLNAQATFRQAKAPGVTATFFLKPFEYNYAYNVNFVREGTTEVLASFTNQEATRSTLQSWSYTVNPTNPNFTIPEGYELVDSTGETVDLTATYKKAGTVSQDVVFYLRAIPVEPPVVPDEPETPDEPDTPDEPPVVPDEPTVPDVPPTVPDVPPTVPVEPEPVPLANPDNTVEIPADATPLVKQRSWALVNLICVVLSLIGAVLTFFAGHKADKEENERLKANGMDEKKNEKFRKTKLFGALMAIAGAIVFIVTELPLIHMIYVDRWTIVNVILLLVHGVGSIYGLRKKNDKQDDTETSNA